MAQEIVRSTRGLKSRRLKGHARLTKKITICLASIICCLSFVAIGVLASVTNLELNIDNDAYYYATAFNKNSDDEFMITSYDDLVLMSELVNGGALIPDTNVYYRDAKYLLTTDIDPVQEAINSGISETVAKSKTYPLNPIGTNETNSFRGEFNGNGHTISNITIALTSGGCYGGLFGYTEGATITGVGIGTPEDVAEDGTYTAGKTCTLYYDLNGKQFTIGAFGSIVGYAGANSSNNKLTTISQCYNMSDVTTTSGYTFNSSDLNGVGVGGIAGITAGASISNCYNTGNISSKGDTVVSVGISCQFTPQVDTVNYCYNVGTITSAVGLSYGLVASFNQKSSSATDGFGLYSLVDAGKIDDFGKIAIYPTYPESSSVKYLMAIDKMSGNTCLTDADCMANLQNQIDGKNVWHATKNTTQMFKFPQLAIFEKHQKSETELDKINNQTDSKNHYGTYKTIEFANFHNFLYDPYGYYNKINKTEGAFYHETNNKGGNTTTILHKELADGGFRDVSTVISNCPSNLTKKPSFKIGDTFSITATPNSGFEFVGFMLIKLDSADYTDSLYLWNDSSLIRYDISSNTKFTNSSDSTGDVNMVGIKRDNSLVTYNAETGTYELAGLTMNRATDGSAVISFNGDEYLQVFALYSPISFDLDESGSVGLPYIYGWGFSDTNGNYTEYDETFLNTLHSLDYTGTEYFMDKFLLGNLNAGGLKIFQSSSSAKFNDYAYESLLKKDVRDSKTGDIILSADQTNKKLAEDTKLGKHIKFFHNAYVGSAQYNLNTTYHALTFASNINSVKNYLFAGFFDASNVTAGMSTEEMLKALIPIAQTGVLYNKLGYVELQGGTGILKKGTSTGATGRGNVSTSDYYINLVPVVTTTESGTKVGYALLNEDLSLSETIYHNIVPIYITNSASVTLNMQAYDGDRYSADTAVDASSMIDGVEAGMFQSMALLGKGNINLINKNPAPIEKDMGFVTNIYSLYTGGMLEEYNGSYYVNSAKNSSLPVTVLGGNTLMVNVANYFGFNFEDIYVTTGDGNYLTISDFMSNYGTVDVTESAYDASIGSPKSYDYEITFNNQEEFSLALSSIQFCLRYKMVALDLTFRMAIADGTPTTVSDLVFDTDMALVWGSDNYFRDNVGYFTIDSVKNLLPANYSNIHEKWGNGYTTTRDGVTGTNLTTANVTVTSCGVLNFSFSINGPLSFSNVNNCYGVTASGNLVKLNLNNNETINITANGFETVEETTEPVTSLVFVLSIPVSTESFTNKYEDDSNSFVSPTTDKTKESWFEGGMLYVTYYAVDKYLQRTQVTKAVYTPADILLPMVTGGTDEMGYIKLTAVAQPGYRFLGFFGDTGKMYSTDFLTNKYGGTPMVPSGVNVDTMSETTVYLYYQLSDSTYYLCANGEICITRVSIGVEFERDYVQIPNFTATSIEKTDCETIGNTIKPAISTMLFPYFNFVDEYISQFSLKQYSDLATITDGNLVNRAIVKVEGGPAVNYFAKYKQWIRVATPTLEGYTFDNWYPSLTSDTPIFDSADLTGNYIYARLSFSGAYSYVNITENTNDGDVTYKVKVYDGFVSNFAVDTTGSGGQTITFGNTGGEDSNATVKIVNNSVDTSKLYARFKKSPVLDFGHAGLTGDEENFTKDTTDSDANHSPWLNLGSTEPAPELTGELNIVYTSGRLNGVTCTTNARTTDRACDGIDLYGDVGDNILIKVKHYTGFKIKGVYFYDSSGTKYSYPFTTSDFVNKTNLGGGGYTETYDFSPAGTAVFQVSSSGVYMYKNGDTTDTSSTNLIQIERLMAVFEPNFVTLRYRTRDIDIFGNGLIYYDINSGTHQLGYDCLLASGNNSYTELVFNPATAIVSRPQVKYYYAMQGGEILTNDNFVAGDNSVEHMGFGSKINPQTNESAYTFVGWGMYGTETDTSLRYCMLLDREGEAYQNAKSYLNSAEIKYDTFGTGGDNTMSALMAYNFFRATWQRDSYVDVYALWYPNNHNAYEGKTYLVLHTDGDVQVGSSTACNINTYNEKNSNNNYKYTSFGYDKSIPLSYGVPFTLNDYSAYLSDDFFTKSGYTFAGFNTHSSTIKHSTAVNNTVQFKMDSVIYADGANVTLDDISTETSDSLLLSVVINIGATNEVVNPYCTIETDPDTGIAYKFIHLYAVWEKDVTFYYGSVDANNNFIDNKRGDRTSDYGTAYTQKYYFSYELNSDELTVSIPTEVIKARSGYLYACIVPKANLFDENNTFIGDSWMSGPIPGGADAFKAEMQDAVTRGDISTWSETIRLTTSATQEYFVAYYRIFTFTYISSFDEDTTKYTTSHSDEIYYLYYKLSDTKEITADKQASVKDIPETIDGVDITYIGLSKGYSNPKTYEPLSYHAPNTSIYLKELRTDLFAIYSGSVNVSVVNPAQESLLQFKTTNLSSSAIGSGTVSITSSSTSYATDILPSTSIFAGSEEITGKPIYFSCTEECLAQSYSVNLPQVSALSLTPTGSNANTEYTYYTMDGWVEYTGDLTSTINKKVHRDWNFTENKTIQWFKEYANGDEVEIDGTKFTMTRDYYVDYNNTSSAQIVQLKSAPGYTTKLMPVFKYHTMYTEIDMGKFLFTNKFGSPLRITEFVTVGQNGYMTYLGWENRIGFNGNYAPISGVDKFVGVQFRVKNVSSSTVYLNNAITYTVTGANDSNPANTFSYKRIEDSVYTSFGANDSIALEAGAEYDVVITLTNRLSAYTIKTLSFMPKYSLTADGELKDILVTGEIGDQSTNKNDSSTLYNGLSSNKKECDIDEANSSNYKIIGNNFYLAPNSSKVTFTYYSDKKSSADKTADYAEFKLVRLRTQRPTGTDGFQNYVFTAICKDANGNVTGTYTNPNELFVIKVGGSATITYESTSNTTVGFYLCYNNSPDIGKYTWNSSTVHMDYFVGPVLEGEDQIIVVLGDEDFIKYSKFLFNIYNYDGASSRLANFNAFSNIGNRALFTVENYYPANMKVSGIDFSGPLGDNITYITFETNGGDAFYMQQVVASTFADTGSPTKYTTSTNKTLANNDKRPSGATGGYVIDANTTSLSLYRVYASSSDGRTFLGWFTAPSGGQKVLDKNGRFNTDDGCVAVTGVINSDGSWVINVGKTLYAQYVPPVTKLVICTDGKYHTHNGSSASEIPVANMTISGSTATSYTVPDGVTEYLVYYLQNDGYYLTKNADGTYTNKINSFVVPSKPSNSFSGFGYVNKDDTSEDLIFTYTDGRFDNFIRVSKVVKDTNGFVYVYALYTPIVTKVIININAHPTLTNALPDSIGYGYYLVNNETIYQIVAYALHGVDGKLYTDPTCSTELVLNNYIAKRNAIYEGEFVLDGLGTIDLTTGTYTKVYDYNITSSAYELLGGVSGVTTSASVWAFDDSTEEITLYAEFKISTPYQYHGYRLQLGLNEFVVSTNSYGEILRIQLQYSGATLLADLKTLNYRDIGLGDALMTTSTGTVSSCTDLNDIVNGATSTNSILSKSYTCYTIKIFSATNSSEYKYIKIYVVDLTALSPSGMLVIAKLPSSVRTETSDIQYTFSYNTTTVNNKVYGDDGFKYGINHANTKFLDTIVSINSAYDTDEYYTSLAQSISFTTANNPAYNYVLMPQVQQAVVRCKVGDLVVSYHTNLAEAVEYANTHENVTTVELISNYWQERDKVVCRRSMIIEGNGFGTTSDSDEFYFTVTFGTVTVNKLRVIIVENANKQNEFIIEVKGANSKLILNNCTINNGVGGAIKISDGASLTVDKLYSENLEYTILAENAGTIHLENSGRLQSSKTDSLHINGATELYLRNCSALTYVGSAIYAKNLTKVSAINSSSVTNYSYGVYRTYSAHVFELINCADVTLTGIYLTNYDSGLADASALYVDNSSIKVGGLDSSHNFIISCSGENYIYLNDSTLTFENFYHDISTGNKTYISVYNNTPTKPIYVSATVGDTTTPDITVYVNLSSYTEGQTVTAVSFTTAQAYTYANSLISIKNANVNVSTNLNSKSIILTVGKSFNIKLDRTPFRPEAYDTGGVDQHLNAETTGINFYYVQLDDTGKIINSKSQVDIINAPSSGLYYNWLTFKFETDDGNIFEIRVNGNASTRAKLTAISHRRTEGLYLIQDGTTDGTKTYMLITDSGEVYTGTGTLTLLSATTEKYWDQYNFANNLEISKEYGDTTWSAFMIEITGARRIFNTPDALDTTGLKNANGTDFTCLNKYIILTYEQLEANNDLLTLWWNSDW